MNKYFLYKDNTEPIDRDSVAYIECNAHRFEGHYFAPVNITGACYSKDICFEPPKYKNLTTILTKDEYKRLIRFGHDIRNLGYTIKPHSKTYNEGIKLCESVQDIFDKLMSEENKRLFDKVVNSEIDYLQQEFKLSFEDIETIFDHYTLGYKDASIISYVYDNVEECGKEEMSSYIDIPDLRCNLKRFFDYKKFGQALVDDGDTFLTLNDGRVVKFNY